MRPTKILLAIACMALLFTACKKDPKPKPGTFNKIECVYITAGSFLMGSPVSEPNRNSDEIQHIVTLTKDFWMSKYEITNSDYCAFLNDPKVEIISTKYEDYTMFSMMIGTDNVVLAEPDIFWDESSKKWVPAAGKEQFPVCYMGWQGAVAYTDWMSEKSGVKCSLPTEAQWEYACRAGQKESLPFGLGDGTKLIMARLTLMLGSHTI